VSDVKLSQNLTKLCNLNQGNPTLCNVYGVNFTHALSRQNANADAAWSGIRSILHKSNNSCV